MRVEPRTPNRGPRQFGERGAALVTVLLFMMLVFILIISMLSVTGNEIAIAGLQRDGHRALELAQAGIQETIRRVEAGRPFLPDFDSSLTVADPTLSPVCPPPPGKSRCLNIDIVNQHNGTNLAYLELQAEATVGRSTRRLSALVLQVSIAYPPDVTFASQVTETGSAEISCGDAYSQTYLQYKNYPTNTCSEPPTITYAGWRVSKAAPGPVAPCYTHQQCMTNNPGNPEMERWYPGIRQTVNPGTRDPGPDNILNTGDDRDYGREIEDWENGVDPSSCPASPPTQDTVANNADPNDRFASDGGTAGPKAGDLVSAWDGTPNPNVPLRGFDTDDPDGPMGPLPPLAVSGNHPCGYAYQWVRRQLFDETGAPAILQPTDTGYWWFKTILFEPYLNTYFFLDSGDERFKKEQALLDHPEYGAIPPFPNFVAFTSNYDCKISGGGTLSSLPVACTLPDGTPSTTDLGCKNPEMSCSPTDSKIIVLEGDWTVNGTIGGYGTLVVNGNLVVNGTFDYWGTIVVNGTLQAGTGNVTVNGGLVAVDTLKLIGNIRVKGGGSVGGVPPVGPANVIGKAWWER